jgi:hypothetical protein
LERSDDLRYQPCAIFKIYISTFERGRRRRRRNPGEGVPEGTVKQFLEERFPIGYGEPFPPSGLMKPSFPRDPRKIPLPPSISSLMSPPIKPPLDAVSKLKQPKSATKGEAYRFPKSGR